MFRKSKLLQAIDPCVRIFSFFCFAEIRIPKRGSRAREKFATLWILMKYLVAMGVLWFLFIHSALGQIDRLRDSHGILIHLISVSVSAQQGFVTLTQTLLMSKTSLKCMKRLEQVDELLLNSLSIITNYDDLRWTLAINVIMSLAFYFASSVGIIYLALRERPHLLLLAISV
jgi:hypothetical protein